MRCEQTVQVLRPDEWPLSLRGKGTCTCKSWRYPGGQQAPSACPTPQLERAVQCRVSAAKSDTGPGLVGSPHEHRGWVSRCVLSLATAMRAWKQLPSGVFVSSKTRAWRSGPAQGSPLGGNETVLRDEQALLREFAPSFAAKSARDRRRIAGSGCTSRGGILLGDRYLRARQNHEQGYFSDGHDLLLERGVDWLRQGEPPAPGADRGFPSRHPANEVWLITFVRMAAAGQAGDTWDGSCRKPMNACHASPSACVRSSSGSSRRLDRAVRLVCGSHGCCRLIDDLNAPTNHSLPCDDLRLNCIINVGWRSLEHPNYQMQALEAWKPCFAASYLRKWKPFFRHANFPVISVKQGAVGLQPDSKWPGGCGCRSCGVRTAGVGKTAVRIGKGRGTWRVSEEQMREFLERNENGEPRPAPKPPRRRSNRAAGLALQAGVLRVPHVVMLLRQMGVVP